MKYIKSALRPSGYVPSRHVWRRRSEKIVLGLIVGVVALRAALPWIVETGINRALKKNEALTGHVGDVDIELWRGAYQLDDLTLSRREPAGSTPFFAVKTADFSVDWHALFQGRFLAKGRLTDPLIDLGMMPQKQEEKAKDEADNVADTVMPVRVSHLNVDNGTLRFKPIEGSPLGALEFRQLNGVATDIRVTDDPTNKTRTKVDATAITPGDGQLSMKLTYDPFSEPVNFDVDARLEHVDLPKLNPLMRDTIGMDVESGKGNVYAEARAEGGKFRGYVKPILENVNILALGKEKATFGQKVKEGLADVVKGVLENQKKDSVAARVPFAGNFDSPSVGVWPAVATVLRHAFIHALNPDVEESI